MKQLSPSPEAVAALLGVPLSQVRQRIAGRVRTGPPPALLPLKSKAAESRARAPKL